MTGGELHLWVRDADLDRLRPATTRSKQQR
jgi:hypothetical protein